jgi:hypothetical protein
VERLAPLATELAGVGPDILLGVGTRSALALKGTGPATRHEPIAGLCPKLCPRACRGWC